ncbi:MAG: hypothetical protein HY901_25785, partial [Deltaproteobacteria bacterium]|nr:hypothetical protein [Deltaproteobacteria bacterium]
MGARRGLRGLGGGDKSKQRRGGEIVSGVGSSDKEEWVCDTINFTERSLRMRAATFTAAHRSLTTLMALALACASCRSQERGPKGDPGGSCSVKGNADGMMSLSCPDGTSVTFRGGADPQGMAAPITPQQYGAKGDGVADDTAAIVAAVAALTPGQALVFPAATYFTKGCIVIAKSNITIVFQGAKFNIADDGAPGEITNTASGPIGFLFKNANNISVLGAARLVGQGTAGSSRLAGMVFDHCSFVTAPAEMYFE